jgi:hypothetical protein
MVVAGTIKQFLKPNLVILFFRRLLSLCFFSNTKKNRQPTQNQHEKPNNKKHAKTNQTPTKQLISVLLVRVGLMFGFLVFVCASFFVSVLGLLLFCCRCCCFLQPLNP